MPDKYLVIGGAGFIGSNLVTHLCNAGHNVVVVDDLSYGYRSLVDQRSTFIQCSMRDLASFRTAISDCRAAFILAAKSIISTSYTNPLSYVDTNISELTIALLEISRAGIPQVIFSSSASVYGSTTDHVITETTPKNPVTIYGATKSAGEELLAGFSAAYGLDSVALRYFNAYGPNDLQQPVTRAVPSWIQAGLKGSPIFMYWNGAQVRDYIYVADIITAHIACIGLRGHRRYNIGSGAGISMRDLCHAIEISLGAPLKILDAGERQGDPMRLVASSDLIQLETGWKAQTTLGNGLSSTIAYYRSLL